MKQPNLMLKTRPKQLLGYLPLAFALPEFVHCSSCWWFTKLHWKV